MKELGGLIIHTLIAKKNPLSLASHRTVTLAEARNRREDARTVLSQKKIDPQIEKKIIKNEILSANKNIFLKVAVEWFATLKRKHENNDEIETVHSGYLGAQDTFCVGNLKGVGRIYKQTFIDTYSKMVHCKLYTIKTQITAEDLLNNRVLPFYQSQYLPMLHIRTDR